MAPAEAMAWESKLSVRATSRAMMKARPKIRIVHLLAPEIIKTEPANFRELVQRLTGKSAVGEGEEEKETAAPTAKRQMREEEGSGRIQLGGEETKGWETMERVKEEEFVVDESAWMARNYGDSTNLLEGLGDWDGFIDGFLEFPQESDLGSPASS